MVSRLVCVFFTIIYPTPFVVNINIFFKLLTPPKDFSPSGTIIRGRTLYSLCAEGWNDGLDSCYDWAYTGTLLFDDGRSISSIIIGLFLNRPLLCLNSTRVLVLKYGIYLPTTPIPWFLSAIYSPIYWFGLGPGTLTCTACTFLALNLTYPLHHTMQSGHVREWTTM